MPRSLSVFVLVFSLILNGCARSSQSTQPQVPTEQKIVWDPPPEKPKGSFGTWCKDHPWLAGTTVALLTVASLTALLGGALAYAMASANSQMH